MKNRKPTITIGIPAYNEEANIGKLLNQILHQKQIGFQLQKVIVRSDGSTDRTVEEVKNIKNKKIIVVEGKKRVGLAKSQNAIFDRTDGDYLLILNGDVALSGDDFLEKFINGVLRSKADLACPRLHAIKPKGFFSRVVSFGVDYKDRVYENLNNGENWYTCRGTARMFSKKLYRKLCFKHSVGEDIYSFFYCLAHGYKYSFIKDITLYYQLPDNFSDHENQSARYLNSKIFQEKEFGPEFVKMNYAWPKGKFIWEYIMSIVHDPIHGVFYPLIFLYLSIISLLYKNNRSLDKWQMVKSTRQVIIPDSFGQKKYE